VVLLASRGGQPRALAGERGKSKKNLIYKEQQLGKAPSILRKVFARGKGGSKRKSSTQRLKGDEGKVTTPVRRRETFNIPSEKKNI